MPLMSSGPSLTAPRRGDRWQTVFAVLIFLEFSSLLLALLIPQRAADLHSAYGQLLIAALAGALFAHAGLPRQRELRVYLAFLLWLLISRWLNRDFYLFLDRPLLLDNLLAFLLLASCLQLDKVRRQRLLLAVTIVYAGFFVLFSAIGLFIALTGTYLHIPPENVWITLLPSNFLGIKTRVINLLSTHRLTMASFLYLAWSLLVYQMLRLRKKGWLLPLALGLLILHLTLTLCYSRTVQICFSLSCAMLALLFLYRRKMRGVKRVLVLVLIPLLCLPVVYKSFDVFGNLLGVLRAEIAPRFEESYRGRSPLDPNLFGLETAQGEASAQEEPAAEAVPAPEAVTSAFKTAASLASSGDSTQQDIFQEHRTLSGNVTLTGRTAIWRSAILSVRAKPSILFYGQPEKQIMPLANQFIHSDHKTHMHNSLVQCFMLTGLPGLLLAAAWYVLLLIKLIRTFFSGSDTPFATAFLTIPLSGIMLYSMLETIMFSSVGLAGFTFFLIAGFFLAEESECARISPEA